MFTGRYAMICQGKLNSKTLKHNDINCWKSSHACHPKQARHLPFNSDWVRFVYYILLFHIFAQMFSTTFRSSACCIKAATFHLKRQWKNIEYVFVPELTRKPHGNPSRRWAGPVTRIEHVKNGNLCCNALSRFYMGRGPWDWSDYVWLFLKLPPPNNNTN